MTDRTTEIVARLEAVEDALLGIQDGRYSTVVLPGVVTMVRIAREFALGIELDDSVIPNPAGPGVVWSR